MPPVIHTAESLDVPLRNLTYRCANKECLKLFNPSKRHRLACSIPCGAARARQLREEAIERGERKKPVKRVHSVAKDRPPKITQEPRASGKPEDPCAIHRDFKITPEDARRTMARYFA